MAKKTKPERVKVGGIDSYIFYSKGIEEVVSTGPNEVDIWLELDDDRQVREGWITMIRDDVIALARNFGLTQEDLQGE